MLNYLESQKNYHKYKERIIKFKLNNLGLPVFADSDGNELDQQEGLSRFMAEFYLSDQILADKIKVSSATVRGWRGGRPINALSMCAIKMFWGAK